MLNPWARAFLWARDHDMKMIAPNWVKLCRIGPLLRGERDKRYYRGMITNDGYVDGWKKWYLLSFRRKDIEIIEGQGHDICDFPMEHESLKTELMRISSPQILSSLDSLPSAYIGVHIRRGDFKVIGRCLPTDYYINAIRLMAAQENRLPILIFSDARKEELEFLRTVGKEFKRMTFMPPAPALHDVLALSRAKALVCTNGSSFSEWAAFLGQMPTIWSKNGIVVNPIKVSRDIALI